jgi:hypothetical protein
MLRYVRRKKAVQKLEEDMKQNLIAAKAKL